MRVCAKAACPRPRCSARWRTCTQPSACAARAPRSPAPAPSPRPPPAPPRPPLPPVRYTLYLPTAVLLPLPLPPHYSPPPPPHPLTAYSIHSAVNYIFNLFTNVGQGSDTHHVEKSYIYFTNCCNNVSKIINSVTFSIVIYIKYSSDSISGIK